MHERLDAMARRWTQDRLFRRRALHFERVFSEISPLEVSSFNTDYWAELNRELAELLLPAPSKAFLRHPLVVGNLVAHSPGRWLDEEFRFLERTVPAAELGRLLAEDAVGRVPVVRLPYRTSHNTVHHLYHLERYRAVTGVAVAQARTIVEWGGGYGNLAKLVTRSSTSHRTYIVVDNPLMCALQWLYLGCVLGESKVNLVRPGAGSVAPGVVNLVPVGLCDVLEAIQADVFISTWALSETTADAQDYVAEHGWFGAPHVLLAYHAHSAEFPSGTRITSLTGVAGARVEAIDFLPGHHYLFS